MDHFAALGLALALVSALPDACSASLGSLETVSALTQNQGLPEAWMTLNW